MRFKDDLTQKEVRTVLDYCPQTGIFQWKYRSDMPNQWNTRFAQQVAGGYSGDGYIAIRINGRRYLSHRLVFLWMTGSFPICEIDHINGIRYDNRFDNLREATSSENKMNACRHKDNKSGVKGIRFHKRAKKYQARVNIDGKAIYLGLFDTAEEAKTERDKVARCVHGDFFKS